LVSIIALLVLISTLSGSVSATLSEDDLGSGPGRFNSIKVGDIDDDGNQEIVFGNFEGEIIIIEFSHGTFELEWKKSFKGSSRLWGIELGDVDMDGVTEIVAGDGHGIVWIIDGKTHDIEWESEELARDAHGIAIGNVDDDEQPEILVGCGFKTDYPYGMTYVIDGLTHEIEGEIGPFDSRMRGMDLGDVDGDGKTEIVFGSGVALGERPGEGYLNIYSLNDSSGKYEEEWRSPDLDGDPIGLAVTDLEGDGSLEIVAGTGYRYRPGFCYVFEYAGPGKGIGDPPIYEQVWMSEDIGPKAFGLVVGDVDSDGGLDIVIGNQPGYLWIFDGKTLDLKWKSKLLGPDLLGVDIADLDNDGNMEIIAASGGYIGKADWSSVYSAPHIFIIDGETHKIEYKIGVIDYIRFGFQLAIVVLIITMLVGINYYFHVGKKKDRKVKIRSRRVQP